MSKIPAILSATLTISLAACGGGSDHTPIGQPVTVPLVTSEPASVGTLTVFNSTDGLFITADAAAGWELRETRLAVTTSLDCIPHSKAGIPNVDHFLLRKKGGQGTTELGYNLRLVVDPGTQLFITLRAKVCPVKTPAKGDDHDGDCGDNEATTVAWAQGIPFTSKDGSMYLPYVVRAAAPPSLVGQFLTYTQASWAAQPGTASSTYLSTNFQRSFPGGVTIGSFMGNSAQFTSSQAIVAFLPESGTPSALNRSEFNPPNMANPFAGETLALALNVGFDAADPAFSSAAAPLSSLVVADPASVFFGLSVADVLAQANLLLAGRSDQVLVSLAEVYDAVTRINANFQNGTADLGFLSLP